MSKFITILDYCTGTVYVTKGKIDDPESSVMLFCNEIDIDFNDCHWMETDNIIMNFK